MNCFRLIYNSFINKLKESAVLALFLFSIMFVGCTQEDLDTLKIDLANTQITFLGKIYPNRFNTYSERANGHHFIVSSGGNNAAKALINTHVPDEQILAGLEALGAVSGDNLSQATWDERNNPNSDDSDQRVQGTSLEIYVEWDQTYVPAYELFQNAFPDDIKIRLGGHSELIPVWQSGCVTCLFSCPGGRTSNEAYTIRDQAQNSHVFYADESILPVDGYTVRVYIKPVFEEHKPFQVPSSSELSG